MELEKLKEVLSFVENHVKTKEYIQHYQTLSVNLAEYAKTKSNEILMEIEIEKNIILNFHNDFTLKHWLESQRKTIRNLNKNKLLGKEAILKLNLLFNKNIDTPAELERNINKIIKDLNGLLLEIDVILKGLAPIIDDSGNKKNKFEDEQLDLLVVSFEDGTFFQNINLLEKFCRIWNRILMSFMYLTNEDIKPVKIHDISARSISFMIDSDTIKALTKGAYEVLKGYKKVLEIRKLQLEINQLNLSNKFEIENLLEDEVINIVDIISSQVTYELTDKFDTHDKKLKEEIFKNIQISLKQIVNFIERGGKVESSDSKEFNELNDKIGNILSNIKDLETKGHTKEKVQFDITFDQEEVERFE